MRPIYHDTKSLENAYQKFGDVMYVSHWFREMQEVPWYNYNPLRKIGAPKFKLRHIQWIYGRPTWYRRTVNVLRKDKRLDLSTKKPSDFMATIMVTVNGRFIVEKSSYKEIERYCVRHASKDCRIEIISAFEALTYQRQGRKKWMLIKVGKGFA